MRSWLQSDSVQGTLESTGSAKPCAKKEANGVEAFAYSTRETCSTGLSRPTALKPLSRYWLLSVALLFLSFFSRAVPFQLQLDSRKRTRINAARKRVKGTRKEREATRRETSRRDTLERRVRPSSYNSLLYRKSASATY